MGRIAGWLGRGSATFGYPELDAMQQAMDPDQLHEWHHIASTPLKNAAFSAVSVQEDLPFALSASKIADTQDTYRFPKPIVYRPNQYLLLWDGFLYHQDIAPGEDASWLLDRILLNGPTALAGLNGRFAFVLVHLQSQEVWLARDAFGVKPLHFSWQNGGLAVASEPQALLPLIQGKPQVDLAAAYDFLVNQQTEHQPNTFFGGIQQVPPGCLWKVSPSAGPTSLQEVVYRSLEWNPASSSLNPPQSKQYVRAIEEQLFQGIKARVRYSQQAAGSLLSGGVDSSLLAAGLARLQPQNAPTFTAAFQESHIGEQSWAQQVAKHIGAQSHLIFPKADQLIEQFEDFVRHQGGPTLSLGTFLQYELFKAARQQGVLQLFDGQGADGLFAGHQYHQPALWSQLLRTRQWRRLRQEIKAYGSWSQGLPYWAKNQLLYHIVPGLSSTTQAHLKSWYYPDLQFFQKDFLYAFQHRQVKEKPARSLNEQLMRGYTGGGLGFLLRCVDRASSRFGVDTHTPFVDDWSLVQTVFNIPGTYKIQQGVSKYLLRQAGRNWIPTAVQNRKDKKALQAPNNAWLRTLNPMIKDLFASADPAIFQRDRLLKEADRYFYPNKELENYRVYKFVSFIAWQQHFRASS